MYFPYDKQNIFAKIIRKEIPCKLVGESDHAMAFFDIAPQAPIHVLIVPKGPYTCASHFYTQASPEELIDFSRFMGRLPSLLGIQDQGCRWISNEGRDGGQEVPHFHIHLLGGESKK